MQKIFTKEMIFVDSDGRQRLFNGYNLCEKGVADQTLGRRRYDFPFDENLFIKLKEVGCNIIRLGFTWDCVEPEAGQYSEENLKKIDKVVALCEKYEIYFYLDMHQDLYGSYLNSPGDGAPYWACMSDGYKFKDTKLVWAEGYFWGKAVHRCFDNFWKNAPCKGRPIQDWYCDTWRMLAARYKDSPALFGFDVMNEPFPGTDGGKVFRKLIGSVAKTVLTDKRCKKGWMLKQLLHSDTVINVLEPFSDPSLFKKVTSVANDLIRKFDTEAYSPFINRTAKAIREITDNGIIIMENCYYSNLGIPCSTPAVNYDGKREEQLCFAPHAYDLMVDTPAYKYASDTRVGSIFDEHRNTQNRLGVPLIVGEWGGASEGTDWLRHINYLLDKFDSYHWGQTYWAYYGEQMFNDPIMLSLLRPAPISVCGTIDSYGLDRENQVFTLNFTQDKEYSLPTEIYLHKAPTEIVTDGEYEITNNVCTEGAYSATLKIKTAPGKHTVTVKF